MKFAAFYLSLLALFGFSFQKKLSTFDVGANLIETIENIEHLKELTEFWVSLKFFIVGARNFREWILSKYFAIKNFRHLFIYPCFYPGFL